MKLKIKSGYIDQIVLFRIFLFSAILHFSGILMAKNSHSNLLTTSQNNLNLWYVIKFLYTDFCTIHWSIPQRIEMTKMRLRIKIKTAFSRCCCCIRSKHCALVCWRMVFFCIRAHLKLYLTLNSLQLTTVQIFFSTVSIIQWLKVACKRG